MAKVHATLARAVDDLNQGDYSGAVGLCRDALEQGYGRDDGQAHPELGTLTNLAAADKAARFWLIRRGLWAVAHAAKHSDEVAEAIEWRRSDAVAAIHILASLLRQDRRPKRVRYRQPLRSRVDPAPAQVGSRAQRPRTGSLTT